MDILMHIALWYGDELMHYVHVCFISHFATVTCILAWYDWHTGARECCRFE